MSLFTQREISKYSLTKALGEIANQHRPGFHGVVTGLEAEVHDVLSDRMKEAGRHPNGFLVPIECLKSQNVTTATAGGFLVGTDLAPIVSALRSKSITIALGAQVFENLRGDFGVPLETTTDTGEWIDEAGTNTFLDEPTYGLMHLTPRRCVSESALSTQLLNQNSLGLENFVRDSLVRNVATALDKAAIAGTGGIQPVGILNYSGTGSVTFGATATRAKVISMQDALTAANVGNTPDASLAYVTSPTTASKWQKIEEVATSAKWLWDGNQWSGTVAGLPARSTTSITDNRVIAGDFSKLIIGLWGEGIEIIADPYSLKATGQVQFLCAVLASTGTANEANFAVSSDSGAQ
jgi:HK97 family phage major capsid protein